MSQIYDGFARVYDLFIDVDYDEWVSYIESIWEKHRFKPELVLELACGTGNITLQLAAKGYDMIGVDISEEMLAKACEKARLNKTDVLFLNQDMREFELYGTVDACICPLDGLNYLTQNEDIIKVFKLVNNYLNPGGIFIFDMNTAYKFKEILEDNTYATTEDNAAYIWENYFDDDEKINEYLINVFVENEETGLYERFEEAHYEKAYDMDFLKEALVTAGLELMNIYDELNFSKPKADSQRLFFVAKKVGNK